MFSTLNTQHISKSKKQLLTDFTYNDQKLGLIVVLTGFVTDFASIGLLRFVARTLFALLSGYGDKSAVIHDYLYSSSSKQVYTELTRKQADQVFFRALRDEGIARWRAGIFYYGVRLFGRSSFKR